MEIIILCLLLIKHWIADFVIQTNDQVKFKGVYGHPAGITHSFDHLVGNLIVYSVAVVLFAADPFVVLGVSFADAILHYHIDWAKMNWGNRDITTPAFWRHLGLDQLMHQLCYLVAVSIIF